MINKTTLIGNVGTVPVITEVGGAQVANFTLATSERWKAADGSDAEHTEWHHIVAWRGLASIVDKYVNKGQQLYIEGKLCTRSWEANGAKHFKTELHADTIKLLGQRRDTQTQAPPPPSSPGGYPF